MSHTCKALILHCIDFRFGKAIKKYLEEQGLLGDIDIVSVAGAAKNLVSPNSPSDTEFILRQIEISKKLHNITELILMNHTDCGAYGGHKAFASHDEEVQKHQDDMQAARELVQTKYPDLEIKTVLATISPTHEVAFETII